MKKHKDRSFALIGVNSDADREALQPVLKQEQILWRSFWNGPQGKNGPISADWNVTGWPTFFLIDHKGVLRQRSGGVGEMDRMLEQCLAEAEKD